MEQLGSQWTDFHEICYLNTLRKSVKKFKFSLKSGKNNGYYTGRIFCICVCILLSSSQNGKLFRQNYIENQFSRFSKIIFENHASYVIIWKNMVEPDRPRMTIWRICISCWIHKSTNRHSEYEIIIAFSLQLCLHERVSMLCHTYIAFLD